MSLPAATAEAERPEARPPAPANGIHSGTDAEVLSRIADPDCAVALWRHRPEPGFQRWLDAIPEAGLPRLRASVALDKVAEVLHGACDKTDLPDGPHRAALVAHVVDLASRLTRLLDCGRLALRLDAGRGQACPKWHLDAVEARLLSSLRGPGTQFGSLQATGADPDGIRDIRQMRTGEVALLRGRAWRGGTSAILHRSPPADQNEVRLLLVMDPLR